MVQTSVLKLQGDRQDRIAALRAQISTLEARPDHSAPAPPEVVPLPGVLGSLLPGGGLARRQVTGLSDCPALAAHMLAQVTRSGGRVAVVGWVELALAQVAEEGDVSKVVVVPEPGPHPWDITCVLLEGMDVVVHRGGEAALSPTRARPILAKLRESRASLITVGSRLPGTRVDITGEVTTYRGIGRGTGRISGLDIEVRVSGRGPAGRSGTVTVGKPRTLELA